MPPVITTVAFDYGGVIAKMIDDTFICHMADTVGVGVERFRSAMWKFRHEYDLAMLEADRYWVLVAGAAGACWPQGESSRHKLLESLLLLDTIAYMNYDPGILRWVKTLIAANYRCIIISNMSPITYEMLVRNTIIEKLFERVILSGWLHVNKPDSEIFLEAVKQMDVKPQQILFIDDLAHNVDGARKVGLNALQFSDTSALHDTLRIQFPDIPRKGLVCFQ